MAEQFDDVMLISEDEYGVEFSLPKRLVTIRKPTVLSEEQKTASSERMKAYSQDKWKT